MMFYAVYYGRLFADDLMRMNLVDMSSNRCIFGRTSDEVIATDKRNLMLLDRVVSTAVGISDYPEYCGTTPSYSCWIAQFEAVRVS